LLQNLALRNIDKIEEPIVYDHFEPFASCQEMQLGIGTPVGAKSWFVFGMGPVPHKLGNRMTEARKKRLKEQEKRRNALELPLSKVPRGETLQWISGGHKSYSRAIADHPEREKIDHQACSRDLDEALSTGNGHTGGGQECSPRSLACFLRAISNLFSAMT
jgi:hypothetical protein